MADITVTDDGLGVNTLGVSGTDAGAFEVDSSGLYIKAGTILDFETKASYSVTVEVDDIGVGATPDASAPYSLSVTDIVNENPPVPASLVITEVTPWASGNAPYGADWFEVTNIGAGPVDVTGWKMDDDSGSFANGVGLSTGGDSVNLFDASGNRVTGVRVGASTAGTTFDNAAGLGSSTLPLPTIATLSAVGVNGAFLASDGTETGSPGSIGLDKTPPVIDPAADLIVEATGSTGAIVPYAQPATLDDVDGAGVATCLPAPGTTFALGTTTVTCTAQDAAGNTASSTFGVVVRDTTPPAVTVPPGVSATTTVASFEYWVSDRRLFGRDDDYSGRDGGHDRNYGRDHRQAPARFEATSITSVVFSDDPGFRPGRGFFFTPPRMDSVSFTGTGKWNGKAGYTFRVTATDQGEPGADGVGERGVVGLAAIRLRNSDGVTPNVR